MPRIPRSEDMPPSWKSLSSASSRLSSFKGYLSQRDFKHAIPEILQHPPGRGEDGPQSWKEWAGEKIRSTRSQSYDMSNPETEPITISLFPGWAARRYRKVGSKELEEAFEVAVFVSGYASSHRAPELASRSQRAFIRLAKGFASLPKLVPDENASDSNSLASTRLTPSTELLLASIQLPPRPTEITEDYELQALEHQFQRVNVADQSSIDLDSTSPRNDSRLSSMDTEPEPAPLIYPVTSPLPSENQKPANTLSSDLHKLHANLESRLHPFWSTALPSRTVRIHLFASPHEAALPHTSFDQRHDRHDDRIALDHSPIASKDVITAADGSFQALFMVNWENMCEHPGALHIAFGDPLKEHDLLAAVELLPLPPSPQSSVSPQPESEQRSDLKSNQSTAQSPYAPQSSQPSPIAPTILRIALTHSPIRVISDIDDTIKLSNILKGARTVFHNVFVKEMKDIIIPGMGEWYSNMWKRGVRFHYVSNGPFELLPILTEFFQVSQIPPGSIKLKSYAGRSLFNGLLSAPAARKRAGVEGILDSFPDSRFILIGDTGEQDLELYADLARDRPDQVLGVFVRDVDDTEPPINDPTGWMAIGAAGTGTDTPITTKATSSGMQTTGTPTTSPSVSAQTPSAFDRLSGGMSYFTSQLNSEPEKMYTTHTIMPTSFISANTTKSRSTKSSEASLSDTEKRRQELQMRVYRARTQMPGHVPLRVFRTAEECVEVEEFLRKEGI